MSLEVSEQTHERQNLVVVGTAVIRGEDLPQIGRVYVFAIIDVVPEPGIPQTGRKFKFIIKEELKGAVTAVSSIGSQGFLMVAQGQKCLVRGLKEDGTLLPVAFIDMQCYVTVVKELKGTGMCLMADAIKGVWLTGYYVRPLPIPLPAPLPSPGALVQNNLPQKRHVLIRTHQNQQEEPYQIRLFSKSPQHIEAIAADFLPDGKQLYIIAADADSNIHILQFDPDRASLLSLPSSASPHTKHAQTPNPTQEPASSTTQHSTQATTLQPSPSSLTPPPPPPRPHINSY